MLPNFKKNLQRLLQNAFWNDFMDVVQEELLLLKQQMNRKRYLYRADEIDNIPDLREINKSFGTFVDLTLMDELTDEELLEYMRQETKGLIFKVKYKGGYEYFKYVFNRVYAKGETYLCFVDGSGIIQKGVDYAPTLENFSNHTVTEPFIKVENFFPTFDSTIKKYTFDSTERSTFDSSWRFDPYLVGQTLDITKHMMIEFSPTTLVSREGSSELYLLTPKYFRYLERAVNNKVQRKTTTIPHIGVQITLPTDESGNVFTVNELNAQCSTTVNYARDYVHVKAGNSVDGYYYQRQLSGAEIHDTNSVYNFVNTWIPGKKIKPEIIAQGDGSNTIFDSDNVGYNKLKYPEIEKKSLRVYWVNQGNLYTGYDDGDGNITADESRMTGEIDYTTGEYRLVFYRDSDETSFAPDNGTDIYVEYYTTEDLLIDKVALLDSSEVEIVEGSFAPVSFHSRENHISVHFIIEKTL